MAEGNSWLSPSGNQRNYGSTGVPNVRIADPQESEFRQLCESVTTNIFTINGSGNALMNLLKLIGTAKDGKGIRDQIHLAQMSAKQIMSQSTDDLKRLNIIARRGERRFKLQAERLTNEFQSAVQKYNETQKQIASKMKSSFQQVENQLVDVHSEDANTVHTDHLLAEEERRQKQRQLLQDLEFEQGMLLEREQRIQQIESDILGVNDIMKELSVMVEQQGQTVNSIENNIESAHTDVEQGRTQLEKASTYQNKARRRLCILLAIGAIVATVLIVILVTQLKTS